jgi:predicted DNA-binding transcriptional regulator AlpA
MHHEKALSLVSNAAIAAVRGTELVNEPRACAVLGGPETPIHRSTLWRGIRAGRYPKPIKVSARACRWRLDELLAVIERAVSDRATAV